MYCCLCVCFVCLFSSYCAHCVGVLTHTPIEMNRGHIEEAIEQFKQATRRAIKVCDHFSKIVSVVILRPDFSLLNCTLHMAT
jgi:hypothetical protein